MEVGLLDWMQSMAVAVEQAVAIMMAATLDFKLDSFSLCSWDRQPVTEFDSEDVQTQVSGFREWEAHSTGPN